MPFSLPSYSQLQASVLSDILASGQVPNGLLQIAILRILGQAIAKNAYLHNEFLRYIAQECVPWTCTDEYLDGWSALIGISRFPALAATSTILVTGISGTFVPSGTTVLRVGDQQAFHTTEDVTLSGTTATIPVIASSTGSNTNGDSGLAGVLGTSITNLSSNVTFNSAQAGGTNEELDPDLRTRMLSAFQAVGSAGSASDYVKWASSSSGVTRVWTNPWGFGIGTTLVYAMLDTQNATNNGYPLGTDGVAAGERRWPQTASGDQLNIANAVFPEQPIGTVVFVASPVPYPIAIRISDLSITATPAVQAAVLAAVQSYYLSVGTPLGCTIFLSALETNIQFALGSTVTFTLDEPTGNITLPIGYLPLATAGNITFS